MKKFPGDKGSKVVADEKCGLHVHFDAKCLSDPKKMEMFKKIYAESEELLYKMCNSKNDPIRRGAINKNYNGLTNIVSSIWRNGMASPVGKKILKQIENGTLKVSYRKFGKLKMLSGKLKLDERRYHGLNLTNIGNSKKNTIEFRMANGTLEPKTIKQNVFLYASLINTAIQAIENPEYYQEKLAEFYKTNVSEEQKANSFLNLIMENPEDKKIYMERWESVKNADVFSKNAKKGFAQNRFQREEFNKIALRTPYPLVKHAYSHIHQTRSKENEKGALAYGR